MADNGLTDGVADFDAAFYETNVRKQVIAQLATGSLPAAATEGRLFADTTANLFKVDTGAALVEFGGWGAWTSYTPTWTNITKGNGASTGGWQRFGNLAFFWAKFAFGSTSAVTGAVLVSLPGTMVDASYGWSASVRLVNTGTDYVPGMAIPNSTTGLGVQCLNAASTYANGDALSSTIPFTWATGDAINVDGWILLA